VDGVQKLRSRGYPIGCESNYEACVTNPETYKLFEGMFQDLLDANKGGKYFVLSTDEPYYVGLAKNDQCPQVKYCQCDQAYRRPLGLHSAFARRLAAVRARCRLAAGCSFKVVDCDIHFDGCDRRAVCLQQPADRGLTPHASIWR
jgi:hypothetical protein